MKNIFSHFALLYGSARVEPDHENHQFSWKTMIFIDFQWFSLIFIDFGQKSWKLMVFDAPGRPPHPVLGQKQFDGIRSETLIDLKKIRKLFLT